MQNNHSNTGYELKDYQGVSSDINVSINPFGKNQSIETIYRRAERLAIATYLVSNLVPYKEEIRNTIRRQCRQLLPLTLEMQTGAASSGAQATQDLIACVRHIVSLLDILHAAGHISVMNVEVLKYAYKDFAQYIARAEEAPSAGMLELNDEFFHTPTPATHTPQKDTASKGHLKDIKGTTLKDTVKDTKNIKDTKVEKGARPVALRDQRRLASRRMLIIDVVAKKGPVHIKDISAEVPDCSIKTLQRELVSLVADNVVHKEGEKRWTTYTIAS